MKTWLTLLRRVGVFFVIAATLYYVRFGHSKYHSYVESREATAAASPEAIEVAIVWPLAERQQSSFVRGAELAVKAVNDSGGVTLTNDEAEVRRVLLRTRYFHEGSDAESSDLGVAAARKIAADSTIQAVVGHHGESAIRASVIYNASGTVFIAPSNTNPNLTLHRFPFVFRLAPDDRQIAQAMVAAVRLVPKKIRLAVVYPAGIKRSPPLLDVPTQLERHVEEIIRSFHADVEFEVAMAKTYSPGMSDYYPLVAELIREVTNYDAILIMDVLPDVDTLRREIEDSFAAIDLADKPILELDSLDWSRAEYLYADMTAELEQRSYSEAAALVLRQTRRRIAILASNDPYGRRIGPLIATSVYNSTDEPVNMLGLELYRTYNAHARSYLPLVAEVVDRKVDFVFLVGRGKDATKLIRELRDAGVEASVICSPSLEVELLQHPIALPLRAKIAEASDAWDLATEDERDGHTLVEFVIDRLRGFDGSESNVSMADVQRYLTVLRGKTFVVSGFDPAATNPRVREFVRKFQAEYQVDHVDWLAAAGYQSIMSLKEAFERAGSASPELTAAAISLVQSDGGYRGSDRFSIRGDLGSMEMFHKSLAADGTIRVSRLDQSTTAFLQWRGVGQQWGE